MGASASGFFGVVVVVLLSFLKKIKTFFWVFFFWVFFVFIPHPLLFLKYWQNFCCLIPWYAEDINFSDKIQTKTNEAYQLALTIACTIKTTRCVYVYFRVIIRLVWFLSRTACSEGSRIDPSWGGPIELFLVPASAPQRPWYVLSCLWDGAYKKKPCC